MREIRLADDSSSDIPNKSDAHLFGQGLRLAEPLAWECRKNLPAHTEQFLREMG